MAHIQNILMMYLFRVHSFNSNVIGDPWKLNYILGMPFSRFKLFNLHKSLTILQFRSFSPLLKSPISTLELTDAALKRLAALRHKFPNKTLRIAVEAGGCHGFQYKFSLINSEGEMNSQEDL